MPPRLAGRRVCRSRGRLPAIAHSRSVSDASATTLDRHHEGRKQAAAAARGAAGSASAIVRPLRKSGPRPILRPSLTQREARTMRDLLRPAGRLLLQAQRPGGALLAVPSRPGAAARRSCASSSAALLDFRGEARLRCRAPTASSRDSRASSSRDLGVRSRRRSHAPLPARAASSSCNCADACAALASSSRFRLSAQRLLRFQLGLLLAEHARAASDARGRIRPGRACALSSHSFLVRQFAFELADVLLALAQHVGRARHVDETSGCRSAAGARRRRRRSATRRARRRRRPRALPPVWPGSCRLERDALDVVLQEQRHVREDLPAARARNSSNSNSCT